MLKHVETGVLSVACEVSGTPDGRPVVLLHGFPYDAHAYDEVAPRLAAAGCRVIVPYLRGYGPTRFLSRDTPRSGQQAVLGHDLLALLDALQISDAVLAGYDWGGRAPGGGPRTATAGAGRRRSVPREAGEPAAGRRRARAGDGLIVVQAQPCRSTSRPGC